MAIEPFTGRPLGLNLADAALLGQALGYAPEAWTDLLPAIEAGMISGIGKQQEQQNQGEDRGN